MPLRHQTNRSCNRLSSYDSAKEPVKCPHEAATQNYTAEELSRLKHLCIDERQKAKITEETRVNSSINNGPLNHLVETAETNVLNPQPEAFVDEPLENSYSAGVTTIVAPIQASRRRRMTEKTVTDNRNTILLDKKRKRSKGRIAYRILHFGQIGYFWSKNRVGILIAVCTVVVVAFFLGGSHFDIAQKRPLPIETLKISTRAEQRNPKPREERASTEKVVSHNAQRKTLLQKKKQNSSPLVKKQTATTAKGSIPSERTAVDLLIAGRLRAAHSRYLELARQRSDQPVYKVIARTLAKQIDESCSQQSRSGNHSCWTPELE